MATTDGTRCAGCQTLLPATTGPGRPRKFCETCSPTKSRQRVERQLKTCELCATEFLAARKTARYCSDSCRNKLRKPQPGRDTTAEKRGRNAPKPCPECGEDFRPAERCQKFCSPACFHASRRRLKRERIKLSISFSTPCLVCGTAVTSKRKLAAPACGTRCRWLWDEHGMAAREPISCPECATTFYRWERPKQRRFCSAECCERHADRVGNHRRDKRIRHAAKRESVSIVKVAERDGWRCHICRRKVTRSDWSLDHLVPVSYGGDHTYANVALAHHRCNSRRGSRGAAQLLLVA